VREVGAWHNNLYNLLRSTLRRRARLETRSEKPSRLGRREEVSRRKRLHYG